MSKRLTESQKRRRRYARQDGKLVVWTMSRAIRYQLDADWFGARPQYANLAAQWQRMSDQSLDFAVSTARSAAHWANLSKENL